MKPFRHRTASLAAVVVLMLVITSTAFAAAQGDPLKLGVANTINLFTTLSGSVTSTMFRVINDSKTAGASAIRAINNGGGPALDLRVTSGQPPMIVSSAG